MSGVDPASSPRFTESIHLLERSGNKNPPLPETALVSLSRPRAYKLSLGRATGCIPSASSTGVTPSSDVRADPRTAAHIPIKVI